LPLYLKEPWERPEFLETAMGFQVAGCQDDAEGRKEFLRELERSVDWGDPTQAGLVFSSEERRPELSVHAALRRGWFFGSQAFRENLMAKLKVKLEEGGRRSANGYHGPEIKDHGHEVAERLATAGCGYFGRRDEDLGALPKGSGRFTHPPGDDGAAGLDQREIAHGRPCWRVPQHQTASRAVENRCQACWRGTGNHVKNLCLTPFLHPHHPAPAQWGKAGTGFREPRCRGGAEAPEPSRSPHEIGVSLIVAEGKL
jgi:hypothetical protein